MAFRALLFSKSTDTNAAMTQACERAGIRAEVCSDIFTAIEKGKTRTFSCVMVDWADQPEASFLLKRARESVPNRETVAVAIVAVIGMRRAFAVGEPSWALSLNAFAALLISPISWSHHWVWVAPGLLVLVVLARRRSWQAGFAAFCGGFVIFMVSPPWLLPHYGDAELQWAPWEQIADDSYAIIAVTMLAVSVRLPLLSRPTARLQVEVQRPRVALRD